MSVEHAARGEPPTVSELLPHAAFPHPDIPLKGRLDAGARARLARRFDAPARALFLPGEQIVLHFLGVIGRPVSRRFAPTLTINGLMLGVTGAVELALFGRVRVVGGTNLVEGLVALVAGLVLIRRSKGSFGVLVAITNQRVVECRTDWRGRPRSIVQTGPAARPRFLGGGRLYRRIAVGDITVQVHYRTEATLWRTLQPGTRDRHLATP